MPLQEELARVKAAAAAQSEEASGALEASALVAQLQVRSLDDWEAGKGGMRGRLVWGLWRGGSYRQADDGGGRRPMLQQMACSDIALMCSDIVRSDIVLQQQHYFAATLCCCAAPSC